MSAFSTTSASTTTTTNLPRKYDGSRIVHPHANSNVAGGSQTTQASKTEESPIDADIKDFINQVTGEKKEEFSNHLFLAGRGRSSLEDHARRDVRNNTASKTDRTNSPQIQSADLFHSRIG